jgi:photosystem II stability/assembly factor-like uncharacterized protein
MIAISTEKLMKSLYTTLGFIVIILSLFISGCDLITQEPAQNRVPPPGNDLIFTEVFTLPPDQFYAYSWIEVYNPTNAPFLWYQEIYPAIIFMVGQGPVAYSTTNDGRTWEEVDLGISPETILKGLVFPWPDTGIAVGTGGTILRLIRRGGVLSVEPVPDADKPADLRNLDLNDISGQIQNPSAWACGDSGRIIRTVNRGLKWRDYYSPTPPTTKNLNAIEFVNFDAIYCVGDSGTLLRSPRANVWETMTPPEEYKNVNFYGVRFISKDTGFAVGDNGAIIYTFTGGNVWIAQASGVTTALRDIFFSNDDRYNRRVVWAVGDNGVILKSRNRGTDWRKIETGVNRTLRVVTFIDSLRGGAMGDDGLILVSESAGEDWFGQSLPNMGDIYAVFYFPPNVYERDYYTLQYRAKRKQFFFDENTFTINYSVFTKIDTGTLIYNPFTTVGLGLFPFETVESIPPGGFTILNNDSIKFTTHHKLGPGQTSVLNASVAYYIDTSFRYVTRPVLWDLLSSGEIRLVNHHERFDRFTNRFLEYTQQTVDMVRWGNYMPGPNDFPGDSLYLNNVPIGYIPEWYSIARYADDVGTSDLNNLSTVNSFYFAKDPIPGWYSQKRK